MGASFPPPSTLETIGQKLRRLNALAQAGNPLTNPPWALPTAWTQSEAIGVGAIRSAGGNQYLYLIAGNTAATGTGPSGTGLNITDGADTARCMFYGVCPIAANDPQAPTITQGTTITGLTNGYTAAANQSSLRLYGATWVGASTSGAAYQPVTYAQGSGANKLVNFRLAIITDAVKVAFGFGSGGGYFRLVIDGRYYSPQNIKTSGSSNPNYVTLDFTAAGGGKERHISIEGGVGGAVNVNTNITGVYVSPLDTIKIPDTNNDVRLGWVSDSISEGAAYGPALAGNNMPLRFGKLTGINDVWNFSKGGTGWLNQGVGSAFYTFRQRLPQVVAQSPNVLMLMGSPNDTGSAAAAVTAEVLLTLQTARASFSGPIGVFGVWPCSSVSNVAATEAAVQAGVTAFGDGQTWFMPLAGLLTGTGKYNGTTGDGNQDKYLGGDTEHPIEPGNEYATARIVEMYRTNMLPFIR